MSKETVYRWCEDHANPDGFVAVSGGTIAKGLNLPIRTLYGYLSRLEDEGRVYKLHSQLYAVTRLVD